MCQLNRPVVLIPALNEAGSISVVVTEIRRYGFDVLVIDDGSIDSTKAVAERAGATVLRSDNQAGLGHALKLGFGALRERGVREVVTMDADGVHSAEFIDGLLRTHRGANADITVGSRFSDAEVSKRVPDCKRASNRFAREIVACFMGTPCSDVLSGMRVLGARVLDMKFESNDFSIALEILDQATASGMVIAEYPISVSYNASELHCTQGSELREFLAYCGRRLAGQHRSIVNRLLLDLADQECVAVQTEQSSFYIHSLRERDAYIFQVGACRN